MAAISGEKEKRQGDTDVAQDEQINRDWVACAETAAVKGQQEISL